MVGSSQRISHRHAAPLNHHRSSEKSNTALFYKSLGKIANRHALSHNPITEGEAQ